MDMGMEQTKWPIQEGIQGRRLEVVTGDMKSKTRDIGKRQIAQDWKGEMEMVMAMALLPSMTK